HQLRRRLLAFAFACRLFGGEVHGHGVGAAFVSHRHAADDIRAKRGPLVGVLRHEFPRPVRVAAAALHHLDEACLVRIAVDVDGNVTAVAEDDLADEQLAGLYPPLVLLGPVTVAPGRLLRLEAGQRDEPAIPGQPGGGSEPARRPGRQLPGPPVERVVHLLRVCHLASDHLNEHHEPPSDTLVFAYRRPHVHRYGYRGSGTATVPGGWPSYLPPGDPGR